MAIASRWERDPTPYADACAQLKQYFAGERTSFERELTISGTTFQQRVWRLVSGPQAGN